MRDRAFPKQSILHVDDYAPARYARTKLLQQAGFHVLEADSGAEALRLAAQAKPQLAILDVNLPDISGFDVCRRLKQVPATANIVVLQLSATYVQPSDQVQGLDTGADAYLVEPVEPRVLIATVRAMLRAQAAEQALALITAQEEVCQRVAQELHDDIGQRLAALTIELEILHKSCPGGGDLARSLRSVILQAQSVSDDVRRVSNGLYPAALASLSLKSGLEALGAEFQRVHKMDVTVACGAEGRNIPIAVSTALYRIAQEALSNAAKHAAGAPVTLALSETGDELRLVIEDRGPGFDLDAPRRAGALGLISMRERARLAKGTLSVRSRPESGTCIEVSVPCTGEAGS